MVRPSIVETSLEKPFLGWNEGINTSAALSYLLGTYFRQLPSNERKRLDVIPVDSVCRGMTLIAAAIVERRNAQIYQLATSVTNPCDMRRSIELTSLAHRKHYRALEGLESWLRLRFDAIPVSKQALRAHVGAGAEGDHKIHSADHVAASAAKDTIGAGGTQSGKSRKADRTVRAIYSSE